MRWSDGARTAAADLVDCGRDVAPQQQLLNVPRLEVAHPDGPQRALAVLLLHDHPALPAQLDDLRRGLALVVGGVDQVQV